MGGRRRISPADIEVALRKPYEFTHNQRFRLWYAWKCAGCGLVRLEDDKTVWEETWLCEVCRVRFNSVSLNS